jgi:hypothetical protein
MSAVGSVTLQTTVPLAGPPSGWTPPPRIGVGLLPEPEPLPLPLAPPLPEPEPLPPPFVVNPLVGGLLEQAPPTTA